MEKKSEVEALEFIHDVVARIQRGEKIAVDWTRVSATNLQNK